MADNDPEGIPVAPPAAVASEQWDPDAAQPVSPGVPLPPDQAVGRRPLSPFERQVIDPSIYGLPAGMSRPMGPMPPQGTGVTWSTTEGGGSSPVTTISGPRPPSDPRAALYQRQAQSNEQLWQSLKRQTANLPIAQTEEAVAAAMRFQGQRQYQRDLAAGVPQAEAFARAAPLMFNAPKQSTLGQAANFLDTIKPPQKYHDVGGVLYQEQPDGSVKAVTGPAAPKFHSAGGVVYREGPGGALTPATPGAVKPSDFDKARYNKLLSEIAEGEKAMRDMTTSKRADEARRLRGLQKEADAIEARFTDTQADKGKRVRVRHPDGKFGTIPESQLEAAKAAGYTEAN